METSHVEITKLRISYLKSVSELDIEDIGENGKKFFSALHDGAATVDDIDEVQNEMLNAHSRRIQPL